ncbi:hypothetical protein LEP1GSC036_0945 [Leptospira weilii str. 2006001853]|uniref:Uncharacterized protein n=2 Tax=Leptospira weilii TaxID=28184 RepID=A0A828Z1Z0_9LEPT|nr:hypothetical protein [Leptospira weilii]EMM70809.1 hypothetical protein LEP1GSC038_2119 [Leptospira weilii str. 2006001855]EKR63758.1 hypothetical protein LEP1GSC036_0945 [Leptospira weilii str. 2006001853]EMN46811.1 hypothetical protein LEP1GSC086_1110 [Leptospira weilii str. LNT 1234]MCL8268409.1 hypothetical protein [Leptospira weilii]QDK22193.1 hypothetical protein FHG67_05195 [Leptospira weilii]
MVSSLFKGIGIIVDDELESSDPKKNIHQIVSQIKEKEIPFLSYSSIPKGNVLNHFQNVSFILLDWRFDKIEEIEGVTMPDALGKEETKENIEFIHKIKETCFCPIFIFSNENIEDITSELAEEGLVKGANTDHIFVKSKADLVGETKLFDSIETWIKSNASVYLLKEWEREYFKAKNKLFLDFYKMNPSWPSILWKTFSEDGVNESLELGELISRNIHTRMTPFEFSKDVISTDIVHSQEELLAVLEGGRFTKSENLHENDISPGDIFKCGKKYYVNVRAICDCVPDRSKVGETIDDVKLYLIRGSIMKPKDLDESYNSGLGLFLEKDSQFIAYPIMDRKGIDFRFRNLELVTWKDVKGKRIGRLLPPFINRLQQKYALYSQRQGLPRLPSLSFPE